MATLEEALVPLFLHHRYQVEAAASALGGQHYIYAMRGDGREPTKPASATEQKAALEALVSTLTPKELAIPRGILEKLPPRPAGYPRHRELFPRFTGLPFDPVTPALVSADHVVGLMLEPERAAGLVTQSAGHPSPPGRDTVMTRLVAVAFNAVVSDAYEAEIARAVQRVLVDRLMSLAATAPMPQVRALALAQIKKVQARPLEGSTPAADRAHLGLLAADIRRFLDRPAEPYRTPPTPEPPPGAPIGQLEEWWSGLGDCDLLNAPVIPWQ